ncbi:MAG: DUF5320 domain-containing protein [Candidatus Sabulitectum sp.]|nr:DUF5320 domain-containing protein [Candidatus Sabulitectum sp.]
MPGGDGSGPNGAGPRGGVCVGAGLRRGFGMGRGRGMGFGRGFTGMGFGRGFAGVYPAYPVNQMSEQEMLENRARVLEQELAALKSRLGQDSENTEN